MNMLLNQLNLNDVPDDPNDIPPGAYDGVVYKSEYVITDAKEEHRKGEKDLSHAITYKVVGQDHNGAQRQQWYKLYINVTDENGNPAEKPEDVRGGQPNLSDDQKIYYKKLHIDLLGISGEEVSNSNPEDLVGVPVTFGLKRNGAFLNVNFVQRREDEATNVAGPVQF